MEEHKAPSGIRAANPGQGETFLAWEVNSGGQGALGVTDSGARAIRHLTAAVHGMPNGCQVRGIIRPARLAPSTGRAPSGYVYGADLIRVHRDPRSGAVVYEGELPVSLPSMPPRPTG